MHQERSYAAPILAALGLVLCPFVLYVTGYFVLQESHWHYEGDNEIWRIYPRQWIASVFEPIGKVESWLTGCDVHLTVEEPVVPEMWMESESVRVP